jgi:RNA polymerase sigma factor (TIGR02999 family)
MRQASRSRVKKTRLPDIIQPMSDLNFLPRTTCVHERETDEIVSSVYGELRRIAQRLMARERVNHTLPPTAVVHEAYVRLAGTEGRLWGSRAQFFAAAAMAVRRVLVEHARARVRDKRGAGSPTLSFGAITAFDPADLAAGATPTQLVFLDEALAQLAADDPLKAQIVELRFFAGLTTDEIARTMDVSASTVAREWRFARAWLRARLDEEGVR